MPRAHTFKQVHKRKGKNWREDLSKTLVNHKKVFDCSPQLHNRMTRILQHFVYNDILFENEHNKMENNPGY